MFSFDTIVAPATACGEGSVGIVRLSGPRAAAMLAAVFSGRTPVATMASHRLYYGRLLNSDGLLIDSVLSVVMNAPHSYTGEEVVEVHCHGGVQVLRSVLNLFLHQGARMADPGEFTRRAFVNGRLDLSQAEAVIDIIRARSERAGRIALAQLEGSLSQQLYTYSSELTQALALLEAHIDFPDDEVGSLDLSMLVASTSSIKKSMQSLADSFDMGRVLRDGLSVLILGRPNVGKSSLLNALLGEQRAIVTSIAGTTRDTLEEQLVLAGFPVRLIDAAGIRDTEDPIELEGVTRAQEKAGSADLILLVVDGSVPLCKEDQLAISLCRPASTLIVVNKCDLPIVVDVSTLPSFVVTVEVSTRSGRGLESLRRAIVDLLASGPFAGDEGVVVTERRHLDALLLAIAALGRFSLAAGSNQPLECLAMDLRDALASIGLITGETTPDEILDKIFSSFCIGK